MYLLDANVIIYFKAAGYLPALVGAAEKVRIVVAREVYDEVVTNNTKDGPLVKKYIDGTSIDVRGIPLKDAPALAALRSGRVKGSAGRTGDLGEDASIVLAVADKNLVFVTNDKDAAFYALGELRETRGRVMTLHVFLRELVQQEALLPKVARQVAAKLNRAPSWWVAWCAAAPPAS
jgi:hypothetical protein